MKNKTNSDPQRKSRRRMLGQLGRGGAIAGAAAGLPSSWVKPVVDTVILPVHAECSLGCDVQLNIGAASVPAACSGSVFPPISLLVEVSQGCGDIELQSIDANLPGQATMESAEPAGAILATGSSFTININNYPSSSPFACQATEPGSITIQYNCTSFVGPARRATFDVLQAILEYAPEPIFDQNFGESETTT